MGRFLLEGDFTISRDDLRFTPNQQRHVFLFKNAILLTKYRSNSNSSTIPSLNRDQSFDNSDSLSGSFASNQNQSSFINFFTRSITSTAAVAANANLLNIGFFQGSNDVGGLYNLLANAHSNSNGPIYEIKQELLVGLILALILFFPTWLIKTIFIIKCLYIFNKHNLFKSGFCDLNWSFSNLHALSYFIIMYTIYIYTITNMLLNVSVNSLLCFIFSSSIFVIFCFI